MPNKAVRDKNTNCSPNVIMLIRQYGNLLISLCLYARITDAQNKSVNKKPPELGLNLFVSSAFSLPVAVLTKIKIIITEYSQNNCFAS